MRLAAALVIVTLTAGLLVACGSDSSPGPSHGDDSERGEGGARAPIGASLRSCAAATSQIAGLRVIAASCGEGRRVAHGWQRGNGCRPSGGVSRAACAVGPYRCSSVRADRGVAVNCARSGSTVAFIARPRR
ncbi:MAG: hypothetical protein ABW065_14410 [Solirubrobacterales bacterium]